MDQSPLYAVIFRARPKQLNTAYAETAQRLRRIAVERYGCLDFVSICEGDQEIAVSYWPDKAAIAAWKADPEHRAAQEQGRDVWYHEYQVDVVRVEHSYRYGT